ncbi:MAG: 16S rRNA (uracil(1498)-N(3))-methyltransferase [Oscillospiraceae bacterium]|jgi:16S rRNA (uracil1498-N3)-methyltransferase|nr:16S rRNA (uracil(1498)-N(3))-methyltransferase [Oscillospiraceae bacterium]
MDTIKRTAGDNEQWRYPRFFCGDISGGGFTLTPSDLRHAEKVLRIKRGGKAVICDGRGTDYLCAYTGGGVFEIIEAFSNAAEPDIRVRLFQCLPKSDKMDFIVQKAVELGVSEIVPVISARCVSRPDGKSGPAKSERYRKIAYEAAKQCGRGKIPAIGEFSDFKAAVRSFDRAGTGIIFYECGGERLNDIVKNAKPGAAIDVFIGSEGGFETAEVDLARRLGITPATLGKRILRVDTASVAAISVLMNLTGNI